jgi:hypothetical protein
MAVLSVKEASVVRGPYLALSRNAVPATRAYTGAP